MFSKGIRTLRFSLLVCIVSFLLIVSICALALPWHGTSSAFASVLQATTATCKHAPSFTNCDAKDPEEQGCASSARTTAHALIINQKQIIGRVERRYSSKCKTWWARIYSYNIHLQDSFDIKLINFGTPSHFSGYETVGLPQFRSSAYIILYSCMFFDKLPTYAAPEVVGSLSSNGDVPGLSATIPLAPAPAK